MSAETVTVKDAYERSLWLTGQLWFNGKLVSDPHEYIGDKFDVLIAGDWQIIEGDTELTYASVASQPLVDHEALRARMRALEVALEAILAVRHWECADTISEVHELARRALGCANEDGDH